ncbi:hypothetical protein [Ammoniphilus sp. YIM 78166]|uniref:hypothetical protein n=1 Tax=Ammoniphilus sp. YIM 78166 TaxID=1644106 RepID=UPI00106F6F97|nr:hypothetical protein [Ammoniphilus sp. YIM 78166]
MKKGNGIGILLLSMMLVITGCSSDGDKPSLSLQKAEGMGATEKHNPPETRGAVKEVVELKPKETETSRKVESSNQVPAMGGSTEAQPPATSINKVALQTSGAIQAASNQPTEEQIKAKYTKELVALQGYYKSQLQVLYQGALADIKANAQSKTAIYNKYAQRGTTLEEESQAKVNQVLQAMKNELKTHHYPVDTVDSLRSSYYAELNKSKSQAMSQVKQALGF